MIIQACNKIGAGDFSTLASVVPGPITSILIPAPILKNPDGSPAGTLWPEGETSILSPMEKVKTVGGMHMTMESASLNLTLTLIGGQDCGRDAYDDGVSDEESE